MISQIVGLRSFDSMSGDKVGSSFPDRRSTLLVRSKGSIFENVGVIVIGQNPTKTTANVQQMGDLNNSSDPPTIYLP